MNRLNSLISRETMKLNFTRAAFALPILLLSSLCGCSTTGRLGVASATRPPAALFGQFAVYSGDGRRLDWTAVVRSAQCGDIVLFGEEHYDPVGSQLQAQLLAALADTPRPLLLAMEFFERDTQASLDSYLAGRLAEPEFVKQTRQGAKYVTSHRPLIELCRAAGIPVLAANAPRRLVRAFGRAATDYAAFRAELPEADQAMLPATLEPLDGPYFERFLEAMQNHPPASAPATQAGSAASAPAATASAPARRPFDPRRAFLTQVLWDESMAETIAARRRADPRRRTMLVVGAFHVADDGGTLQKLRARRPGDRIVTVVFRGAQQLPAALREGDRGAGDFVIYGIQAPPEENQ